MSYSESTWDDMPRGTLRGWAAHFGTLAAASGAFPLMVFRAYSTDLSDQEWRVLAPLLPPAKPGGRPRSVELRRVLDGIFYLVRSGCAWRLLPHEFPPSQTVYRYCRQWRND